MQWILKQIQTTPLMPMNTCWALAEQNWFRFVYSRISPSPHQAMADQIYRELGEHCRDSTTNSDSILLVGCSTVAQRPLAGIQWCIANPLLPEPKQFHHNLYRISLHIHRGLYSKFQGVKEFLIVIGYLSCYNWLPVLKRNISEEPNHKEISVYWYLSVHRVPEWFPI